MPTLADIYSAADSFKRRLSDAAMNPGASLQQMLGYANDRARVLNEMTSAAAQEKDLYGPATQALGQKLAEAYNPVGMTVYHGSPHLFEKFDLNKIGTGEGAQAYGRGLYMAEAPQVAKEYQEKLSSTGGAKRILSSASGDIDAAITEAQRKIKHYEDLIANGGGGMPEKAQHFLQMSQKNLEDLNAIKQGLPERTGAFYKVDLPDTHVRRMLDWDAPLKDQPKQVRQLAKSLGMDLNDLGGDLLAKVGKGEEGKKILEDAGIRGIRYLDEKSRFSPYQVEILHKGKPYATSEYATKEQALRYAKEKEAEGFQTKHRMVGTRNFVVFNPEHLTILERNAEKLK